MAGRSRDTIRMSTDDLEDIRVQLKRLESELTRQCGLVRSVAGNMTKAAGADLNISMSLRLSVGSHVSGGSVRSVLSGMDRTLRACSDESTRMAKAIADVQSLFEENESRLISSIENISIGSQSQFAGAAGGSGTPIKTGAAVAAKGSSTEIDWRLDELLKNIFTSMGTVGDFFYSLATINTPAGLAKFLVKGSECIGEWKSVVKGFSKLKNFGTGYAVKTYAKKLLGLNSYAASMGFSISKANTTLGRYFSNLTRSGAFKKGMTSAASWILEGIDKGIENYQEYNAGYKDGGTAVAEWACETTLAVAAGAGTVALIGAAIPAAPALLVAAAGGIVVWGVDTLWANTLGRGKDEDGGNEGLIETLGEGIVEGGKYVAQKASEFGQKVGDALSDGIGQAKKYLANGLNIRAVWAN